LLVGVTVLTSANRETLREIGMIDDLSRQVVRLAKIGRDFGIGGVVASAYEIEPIRKAIGQKLRLIIPGIRPRGSDEHDQKRTMSPAEAVKGGADFLVVGRPITASDDPAGVARGVVASLR
jgi:orotidine-5'-phosphate decarboxylase